MSKPEANGRRTPEQVIHMLLKKDGLRARINAKCVECVYSPDEPGYWGKQVQACTSTDCPLHPVRHGAEKVQEGANLASPLS